MNGTPHYAANPAGREDLVTVHIGDRISVESERVGQAPRSGTVEEVLAEMPTRLRVRWDDGRSSVLVPAAGSAHIEAAQRPVKPRRARG
jgi:hypothetical protein